MDKIPQSLADYFANARNIDELKEFYRRLARENHPDYHPEEIEKYTRIMADINLAFEEARTRLENDGKEESERAALISKKCLIDSRNIAQIVDGTYGGMIKFGFSESDKELQFLGVIKNPYLAAEFLGSFTIDSIKLAIRNIRRSLEKLRDSSEEDPIRLRNQILHTSEILYRYFAYLSYGFNVLMKLDRQRAVHFGRKAEHGDKRNGIELFMKQIDENDAKLSNYETLFTQDLMEIDDLLGNLLNMFRDNGYHSLLQDLSILFNKVYRNPHLNDSMKKNIFREEGVDEGAVFE